MLKKRISLSMILSLLILAVITTGCDKRVSLRFKNHTDDSIDIELDGPGYDDELIGKIPPYGYYRYDLRIPERHLPAHYELDADEDEEFTINKYTPSKLYIHIHDDKLLIGPSAGSMRRSN